MAGDPKSESYRVRPRSIRLSNDHLKALSTLTLFLTDSIMLIVAFIVGYEARELLPFFSRPEEQPDLARYLPTIAVHAATIVVMFYFSQLYHLKRAFSRIEQLRNVIGVVTLGTLLASGTQEFLLQNTSLESVYPRSLLFYVWFFSVVLTVVGRELHRRCWTFMRRRGVVRDNLLIVGEGSIARKITEHIRNSPELGYTIVGIVTSAENQGDMLGYNYIGTYDEIPRIIDDRQVEQVIVALSDYRRGELVELINLCQRGKVDIKVYPDMFSYMAGDLNVDDLGGTPLLTVRDIALRGWKLSLKRALDLFGATVGLVLLSPFMLFTALLIRLESRGSIFYWQVRMGLDGRPFPMIKFRSMRQDAESRGRTWTVENDERVTRLGRLMRRSNWDEIPQLINVLVGHMSLVGPRPERPMYVQQFQRQIPDYMVRHREKSGMTGWAQINGLRGDTSIAQRTEADRFYVENWSLWLDIVIIIRTLWQSFTRSSPNAY
ncbi:MAG: undecaprenyl-phosphate glucose phosphotransferase [Chloroflexota bacterium]|nr:undecaprenyl-phosphate glucose phosphotransferase [Chloroflexota bacterium]MDE2853923.1 undecaprenyl-phosphate glucose phosphotransferase [Chloroflexota bacterium]MDE2946672.1 undecaprenyl-phosphate glucose phosphotransferase [Chloroflexota bacterium]